MNLHIFQDSLGHYTSKACERITHLSKGEAHLFINIVKSTPFPEITGMKSFTLNWKDIIEFINSINGLQYIYFHSYNSYSQFILEKVKEKQQHVIFIWIFWSGEFYNLPEFIDDLYIGRSKKYLEKNTILGQLRLKANYLKQFMNRPYYIHNRFIASFHHIDFFASLLEEDWHNVSQYSGAKMKYIRFGYLSFSQFINQPDVDCKSDIQKPMFNLMLNHSGDPTLNHFDALGRLQKIDFKGKIILSLSYGNKRYINDLKTYMQASPIKSFEIWDTFTESSVYARRLSSIDFAVFNASVQQGLGNIILLLWYGVKLFLREENSIYIELKKWGMHIYSVQNELTYDQLTYRLTDEKVQHNRSILRKYFSEDAVDSYYHSLINLS
jgi:dTDP-N-acetylfucosamine:lipid II N-acetylfucosaminyltransferase